MPKLKEMTPEQLENLVSIASSVLAGLITLMFHITELIKGSDMSEQNKEVLIARIKAAQDSVPEWK